MSKRLVGFEPVPLEEATALLAKESGSDGDLAEIALILGRERPVLSWAASLAKTVGWEPLRSRIVRWSSLARAPWHEPVEQVMAALEARAADLLSTLAACDAPFAWDVLEAVVGSIAIDDVCDLEEAGVLVRHVRDGIVTFSVPFAVRAVHRARGGSPPAARQWLGAWLARALDLRTKSYGPRARTGLSELASAVPLASRALFDEETELQGLALWDAASDAIFFAEAIPFDAPAFGQAVRVADARGDAGARVRARIIAARALLEQGDPGLAAALANEALALAEGTSLRSDALRSAGWAAIALSALDDAKRMFEAALALAEGEPRGQADATAGLGVTAMLEGDPAGARGLLSEALAIHVVMRDAPREEAVRRMIGLLSDAAVEEGALAAQVALLRAKGQRWREALVLARLALAARARGDGVTADLCLDEARAAALLSNMPAATLARSIVEGTTSKKAIVVATDGRALTLPSGERHDLARHGPVRRILWTLALARRDRPGRPMTTLEMIAAGWPGEKMKHEAATLRVYTTIRRLRSLGLEDAVVTHDDGYLLDPEVAIEIG